MKKEKIAPFIKLKYFKRPEDDRTGNHSVFICSTCKKESSRIGSGNYNTGEINCEKCAIKNYAELYGIKSLKVAESYRRRMFDVNYLFQEKIIDYFLKKENKTFEDLSDEEHENIINFARDLWNDEKIIKRKEKINLEYLYFQKDIESDIDKILKKALL